MPRKDEKSDAAESAETVEMPAEKIKHDETIPGGKYVVDGVLRNANGQAIDDEGNVLAGEPAVPTVLLPNAPVVQ